VCSSAVTSVCPVQLPQPFHQPSVMNQQQHKDKHMSEPNGADDSVTSDLGSPSHQPLDKMIGVVSDLLLALQHYAVEPMVSSAANCCVSLCAASPRPQPVALMMINQFHDGQLSISFDDIASDKAPELIWSRSHHLSLLNSARDSC